MQVCRYYFFTGLPEVRVIFSMLEGREAVVRLAVFTQGASIDCALFRILANYAIGLSSEGLLRRCMHSPSLSRSPSKGRALMHVFGKA